MNYCLSGFYFFIGLLFLCSDTWAQTSCGEFFRSSSKIQFSVLRQPIPSYQNSAAYKLIERSEIERKIFDRALNRNIKYGDIELPTIKGEYDLSMQNSLFWIEKLQNLKTAKVKKTIEYDYWVQNRNKVIEELDSLLKYFFKLQNEKDYSLSQIYSAFAKQSVFFSKAQILLDWANGYISPKQAIEFLIELASPNLLRDTEDKFLGDDVFFHQLHGFYIPLFTNLIPSPQTINRLQKNGSFVISYPKLKSNADGVMEYTRNYADHDRHAHFSHSKNRISSLYTLTIDTLPFLKDEVDTDPIHIIQKWKKERRDWVDQLFNQNLSQLDRPVDQYLAEAAFFTIVHENGNPAVPSLLKRVARDKNERLILQYKIMDNRFNRLAINHVKGLELNPRLDQATSQALTWVFDQLPK